MEASKSQSEHAAKQRGASESLLSLLPLELWLAVMRELGSMRDHRAFALTCALFAALARAEVERSKQRLARETEKDNSYRWDHPIVVEKIVGPCLANGRFHGRCTAHCAGNYLIEFEAQDGLRQGEARLLRMPTRLLRGTFCFVNDKLEGADVLYANGYRRWFAYYEDDQREGYSIFCNLACSADWQYYEHGRLEGYGVMSFADGDPRMVSYYEDDEPITICIVHENGSRAMSRGRRLACGWATRYYSNGSLRDLAFYEDGIAGGRTYDWHDNGQLAAIYDIVHEGVVKKCRVAWDREGNPINPIGI